MTRQEEFEQAAADYLKKCFALKFPTTNERLKESDLYGAFKHGAQWTINVIIEKACEWLKKNADDYTWYNEFSGESGMTEEFYEDFREAMINN